MAFDPKPRFGAPITDWTTWFAWHPIKTWDQRWRFLCRVKRRLILKYQSLDGGADFWWQYADR